jgi:uncharacterized protein
MGWCVVVLHDAQSCRPWSPRGENSSALPARRAGENIGSGDGPLSFLGHWTERKKHMIMESRRRGTSVLARAFAVLEKKPAVFVSASGVGYYGSQGDRVLDESAGRGRGFLADVADVWEKETAPAARAGIRCVQLRLGVVLSNRGGVVQKLQVPYSLGLGGPVGSGSQYMSWIALGDTVRAIEHAIHTETLSGPVNCCAPNPATSSQFAAALGRALHRPAFFPLPEAVVRATFGEMGEETLLASQRAVPTKLVDSGFRFLFPDIDDAMRAAVSHTGGIARP